MAATSCVFALLYHPPLAAAPCNGPFAVDNATFPCDTIPSGQSCIGQCGSGYSGTPVASCAYGVYTVAGTCQAGKLPDTTSCSTRGFPLLQPLAAACRKQELCCSTSTLPCKDTRHNVYMLACRPNVQRVHNHVVCVLGIPSFLSFHQLHRWHFRSSCCRQLKDTARVLASCLACSTARDEPLATPFRASRPHLACTALIHCML